jgi:hypothetical protein
VTLTSLQTDVLKCRHLSLLLHRLGAP